MADVISLAERLKSHRDELGIEPIPSGAGARCRADRLPPVGDASREAESRSMGGDQTMARRLGLDAPPRRGTDERRRGHDGRGRRGRLPAPPSGLGHPGSSDDVDFFAQARRLLSEASARWVRHRRAGRRTHGDVRSLETENAQAATTGWEATDIRKELVADADAPRKAREALTFAASDLPERIQEEAALLVSELVTNSVITGAQTPRTSSVSSSAWVGGSSGSKWPTDPAPSRSNGRRHPTEAMG